METECSVEKFFAPDPLTTESAVQQVIVGVESGPFRVQSREHHYFSKCFGRQESSFQSTVLRNEGWKRYEMEEDQRERERKTRTSGSNSLDGSEPAGK